MPLGEPRRLGSDRRSSSSSPAAGRRPKVAGSSPIDRAIAGNCGLSKPDVAGLWSVALATGRAMKRSIKARSEWSIAINQPQVNGAPGAR